MNIIVILLVVLAGMGLSFEAGLLGPLGNQVGHLWATLSIFGVGTALLWLISIFTTKNKKQGWRSIPRWQLTGGLLGPIYVVVLTLATPTLGVAMTMIGVLAGQVGKSFAIDYFGWFGISKQPINRLKITGMLFVIMALIFTYLGAFS
ncbi:DMT family transporter [Pseudoalteromonas sp. SG43-3]|uniref:DMT family transporter n=1 Tax=Pseudoalteromonas sp. SG43-3 TaxID=2760970 RepID=UPI001601F5BE|nr:DMT family transporter [Pseudoalteromonas sp. SG43-3]MBB1442374.1 DMT family transporter [Pseudoalteromonas sp. SG43-3]|tara:strand:- start:3675 stop:4118 length:444 start_codon:yes stop_codon:yes gene_type:complete